MNIYSLKNLSTYYCNNYTGLNKSSWVMISLKLITGILISIYYFLPIYFVDELNLSVQISGFLIGSYGVGTVFGGLIGGKISDKLSPAFICVISQALAALAFIWLIFIRSQSLLLVDLFLLGTATYSLITSIYILTLSACQENESQRLKAINILETASNLGLGLAAVIIGMIELNHIYYLFLIAGFTFILTSIFMSLYFSRLAIATSNRITHIKDNQLPTLNKNHARRVLIFVFICLFVGGLMISQLSSTYSIYLNQLFPEYHFGGFGIAFALNTFLIVVFQTPLANYCGKYNYTLIAGTGIFLLGFGMFLLMFTHSFYFVLLTCGIYTLGEMLFFSVSTLICYENSTADKKGLVLGIYRMVYATSRIFGPIAGSYIFYQFGSKYLWYSCGALGALCFMNTFFFINRFNFSS